MSDTAAPETTPNDLLDNLRELGRALPVNFQPNAHDQGALTAGIIWYLATGSLVPPKIDTPDEAAAKAELAETTALNEANARIAELERQAAAREATASPVAPAPVVATEPTPTPPVETPPPAVEPPAAPPQGSTAPAPVDPPAATPINADAPPVGQPPAQG